MSIRVSVTDNVVSNFDRLKCNFLKGVDLSDILFTRVSGSETRSLRMLCSRRFVYAANLLCSRLTKGWARDVMLCTHVRATILILLCLDLDAFYVSGARSAAPRD